MVRRTRKSKRMTGGKKFKSLVGTRAEVMHGTAYKTSYGAVKPKGDALTRADLKMNKHGRIVSSAKSKKGPMMLKRLHNKGYFTRKGKFGAIKKGSKTAKKSRRKGKSGKKGRKCRHKSGKKKGKYKKCKTKKRR